MADNRTRTFSNNRKPAAKKPLLKRMKPLLLVLLFFGMLVFFNVKLYFSVDRSTSVMEESTLPTVKFTSYGYDMNELEGYIKDMNPLLMRKNVVPIESDLKLPIIIHTAGSDITSIRYEIRSLDNTRKIADTEVEDYLKKGNTITAEIEIQPLIDEDEEYLLLLMLEADGRQVSYYTRMKLSPDSGIRECLNFVRSFHYISMDKGKLETLAPYIEPDRKKANDSLYHVNINSSLDQIGWADFGGAQDGDVHISVSDIDVNGCSITYRYRMVRDGAGNEVYDVTEYYRTRVVNKEVYLLDFERIMEERFDMDLSAISDTDINLGIVSPNPNYAGNDIGTICAFVSAGDLYVYSEDDNSVVKAFSFRGKDERLAQFNHEIDILSVDGTGMVEFMVRGYMAAGPHEGHTGIAFYHYDETGRTIEELAFMDTNCSSEVITADIKDLFYENAADEILFTLAGNLIKIEPGSENPQVILSGLTDDNYLLSANGRYLAFVANPMYASKISIMDLESLAITDINAPFGCSVKLLGYLEDDLIYGVVGNSDIYTDDASRTVVPMRELNIVGVADPNNDILKNYKKEGYYITSIDIDGYVINLNRLQRTEAGFKACSGDAIMNSNGETVPAIRTEMAVDEHKQQIISLILKENKSTEAEVQEIRGMSAQMLDTEGRNVPFPEVDDGERYYVFVGDEIIYSTSSVKDAVGIGNQYRAVVVNSAQKTIWKRSRSNFRRQMNLKAGSAEAEGAAKARAVSCILNLEGENIQIGNRLDDGTTSVYSILNSTLKDYEVMDLTGLGLSEMLYFISKGTPVYTELEGGVPVLLIGFDTASVSYYDPMTNRITRLSTEKMEERIYMGGNVFVAYVR